MDKLYKLAATHSSYISKYHKYKMVFWSKWDYSFLTNNIMYYKKKGKFQKGTWNDIIIGADTETSKGHEITKDPSENHVCAWTISIRAYHNNIVTLYGTRPSEMMQTFQKIREALKGDEFVVYFHNAAYDYVFLRLFFFKYFGTPVKELNTKPHYPIILKFENGMILKDSLILSQCKLVKWANDLNVHHKKAVGSWDYDAIRDQQDKPNFTRKELRYIENDTLALVECIDALCIALNKNISSMPYTATGIVREELREIGKKNNAHKRFMDQAPSFEFQQILERMYHGGFSHANRFYIGEIMDDDETKGFDFNSSYPFCLCAFPYPGKFVKFGKDLKPDYIERNSEKYAFIFNFKAFNIRLKDQLYPMPALQASKCDFSINMKVDNGRIKRAGYVSIWICEQDLLVLSSMYEWDDDTVCTDVYFSKKKYLPRWYTDYVYQRYEAKCKMKPIKDKDPVGYSLAKSKVNLLYGLSVQKPCRQNFLEVTEPGEYKINENGDTAYFESGEYRTDYDQDMRKEYDKFVNNPNSILPYTIGCYCTAYAFRNLFKLGECVNKHYIMEGSKRVLAYPFHWYYSDTDSAYSDDWNIEKVKEYNEDCKKRLLANGYGPVKVGDKEYWLGVAENDTDANYSEFVFLGSKRYAGRSSEDNELHITVAGVPKKGAVCLKDDLKNFTKTFIFDGEITGKLMHNYIFNPDGIHTDVFGNEVGDSIDLSPCDYELDAVDKEEYIYTDDYYFEYHGEENFDIYDQ